MSVLDDYLDLDDGPPCPGCGYRWDQCACPWPTAQEERARMSEEEKREDVKWEEKR